MLKRRASRERSGQSVDRGQLGEFDMLEGGAADESRMAKLHSFGKIDFFNATATGECVGADSSHINRHYLRSTTGHDKIKIAGTESKGGSGGYCEQQVFHF
jgi:hypothetical protein